MKTAAIVFFALLVTSIAAAFEKPATTFQGFQFPHHYQKPGSYVVVLDVTGPGGSSRRSKVWDIQLR